MDETISAETPPRAWGRPAGLEPWAHAPRNTPTGVGKTDGAPVGATATQKHPHGRGEDHAVMGF